MLGPSTKLTYAADWSEYFGYHPADGSGEVHYHLDPLWACDAIDAVGIDNYMPLSDWRDGDLVRGNPDGFRTSEDAAALRAMLEAGEGYDWYYASESDRNTRIRTPIQDGLAQKPWVYRTKDMAGWWSHAHHNRIGGAEQPTPTVWVPGSKPVWFTELGCPAIDKGANQPNVFVDAKSSETAIPYFSGGGRNDALQRRFLESHHDHWSAMGAAVGVDPEHLFVWTWDTRPQPAFPQNSALWADGDNWQTGHWLTGRLGAGTAGDIVRAILADHGFDAADTDRICGDLSGYVKAEQGSARALLEPLMAALQIDAVEEGAILAFRSRMKQAAVPQPLSVLAEQDDEPLFEESRGHDSDYAAQALLDHTDPAGDYKPVTTRSRRMTPANQRLLRLAIPGVLHETAAIASVEDALRDHQASRRGLHFTLPPNALSPEPGDTVSLPDGPAGLFTISRIEDGDVRRIEARGYVPAGTGGTALTTAQTMGARQSAMGFAPVVQLMDLPVYEAGSTGFARGAVFARPWQPVLLSSSETTEGYRLRQRFDAPAQMGVLAQPLAQGVSGRFDRVNVVVVDLYLGGLSSVSRLSVLNGQNRLAIRADIGAWEILGFETAEEIAPGRFQLTGLLRGLAGTEDAMVASAGAAVVVLGAAVKTLALADEETGRPMNWLAEAAGKTGAAAGPYLFAGGWRAHTPLSPVHLRGRRLDSGDIALSWVRRARLDADPWLDGDIALDEPQERYRLEVLQGRVVKRMETVSQPAFLYPATAETEDFGARQAVLSIRVRQVGQTVALGLPAEAILTL